MFKRSWGTVFFVISLFSFSWPHYLKLSMNAFSYGLQGWMGPNYSISTACATSNFCILNAANHIIRGEAVSIFALLCALRILDFSYFPLPFLFWTKFGSMMLSFCQKVLTNLVNMKFVCRM